MSSDPLNPDHVSVHLVVDVPPTGAGSVFRVCTTLHEAADAAINIKGMVLSFPPNAVTDYRSHRP